MSLYIGNLSSRTRRDELERVFRKFGRCTVRMKDGYGFVVFEHPPNAEKALKALHGRRICGELLTLLWSAKQPTTFRRFRRNRASEPRHRNSPAHEDYFERKFNTDDKHLSRLSMKQPDNDIALPDSADVETAHHKNDIKDDMAGELPGYREDILDANGKVQQYLPENDRWGDQFLEQSTEAMVGYEVGFDRYEPQQGDDKRDYANEATLNSSKYPRSQQTCYNCGGFGHRMRNCPQHQTVSGRKFSRSGRGHNDNHTAGRGKGELEVFQSKSWDGKRGSRDSTPTRRQRKEEILSSMGKQIEPMMTGLKETDGSQETNHVGREQNRKKVKYPKGHREKKHEQGSHSLSNSRSISSREHSLSSDSRSTSAVHHSESKRSRSRSSSPTSLSLSVSLGQPLPSSSNKGQMSLKGSSDIAKTPESKEILDEHGQPVAYDAEFGDAKRENEVMAVNKEILISSSQMESELETQPMLKENDDYQIVSMPLYEVREPTTLLADKGEAARSSFLGIARPAKERETSGALRRDSLPVLNDNLNSRAPINSGHQTSISMEEVRIVLKHHGLNVPNEKERQLSTEGFFGSARFWPWEIIYYRRLKKGLVSVENYARRIDQNREFGIVDKYIRSSSGWGELAI